MPVICGNFFKYVDHNKMKYVAKICRIMPRSHIRIKPAYGNGESVSLCRKICNMHTFGKYANNATITYSHKTGMPKHIKSHLHVNICYFRSFPVRLRTKCLFKAFHLQNVYTLILSTVTFFLVIILASHNSLSQVNFIVQ